MRRLWIRNTTLTHILNPIAWLERAREVVLKNMQKLIGKMPSRDNKTYTPNID